MASKSGQKVRLVKCPKCLKILQEDEDVPVYRCGGCSAILQGHYCFHKNSATLLHLILMNLALFYGSHLFGFPWVYLVLSRLRPVVCVWFLSSHELSQLLNLFWWLLL